MNMNMNINMQCNIMRYFEKESAIVNALNSVCEDAPFSINIWTIRWAYQAMPELNIELCYTPTNTCLIRTSTYYENDADPEKILDKLFPDFEQILMKNIIFSKATKGCVFDGNGNLIYTFADIVDKLIMK